MCKAEPLAIMAGVFNRCRKEKELIVPPPSCILTPEPPSLTLEMALEKFSCVEKWRQHRDVSSVKIQMLYDDSKRDRGKGEQLRAAIQIQKIWKGHQTRKELQ